MQQGSKVLMRFSFILVLIASVFTMAGCSQKLSEDIVLQRIIERVASHAKAKDVDGVFSYISNSFSDDRGNDLESLRHFIFNEFFLSENINIVLRSVNVNVKGAEAIVNLRMLFVKETGIKGIGVASAESVRPLIVNLVFQKEDGQWKALSAKWKEIEDLSVM